MAPHFLTFRVQANVNKAQTITQESVQGLLKTHKSRLMRRRNANNASNANPKSMNIGEEL